MPITIATYTEREAKVRRIQSGEEPLVPPPPDPRHQLDDPELDARIAEAAATATAAQAQLDAAIGRVVALEQERLAIHRQVDGFAAPGRSQRERERLAERLGPLAAELKQAEALRDVLRRQAERALVAHNRLVRHRWDLIMARNRADDAAAEAEREAARLAAGGLPRLEQPSEILFTFSGNELDFRREQLRGFERRSAPSPEPPAPSPLSRHARSWG